MFEYPYLLIDLDQLFVGLSECFCDTRIVTSRDWHDYLSLTSPGDSHVANNWIIHEQKYLQLAYLANHSLHIIAHTAWKSLKICKNLSMMLRIIID